MAKAVAKATAKAATPDAVKAKGAASLPAVVTMPKAAACSLSAGPEALKYVAAMADDLKQMDALEQSSGSNRRAGMVITAMAIYRLVQGDNTVNLAASVTGDKSAKNRLGHQIRLGLGLERFDNDGKIVPTQAAIDAMFHQDGDDDKTISRKESVRTKYSNILTQCSRIVLDAVTNGTKLSLDGRHLRLTGPDVKAHFGETSVLLNEQQNVPVVDKRGKATGATKTLKALPSFTEIQRKIGAAHGKATVGRVDSRFKMVDPLKHVVAVCGSMVEAISKLPAGKMSPEVRKALESVYDAIDKLL